MLDALGDRGRELARQHQVRAVADDHEDLALGRGELDAHAARDLVAHARVAVLDVVALAGRVARAPELVQVAGHRAGRAHDDAGLAGRVVDRADDRRPGWAAAPSRGATSRATSSPHAARLVGGARASTPRRRASRPARRAARRARARASATTARPLCLAASNAATLMLTKRTSGVLEGRLRRGREVAPARADADHEVGVAGQPVGGRRAGRADRAERRADGRTAARHGPACVSPTGMPVASTNARSASVASL